MIAGYDYGHLGIGMNTHIPVIPPVCSVGVTSGRVSASVGDVVISSASDPFRSSEYPYWSHEYTYEEIRVLAREHATRDRPFRCLQVIRKPRPQGSSSDETIQVSGVEIPYESDDPDDPDYNPSSAKVPVRWTKDRADNDWSREYGGGGGGGSGGGSPSWNEKDDREWKPYPACRIVNDFS